MVHSSSGNTFHWITPFRSIWNTLTSLGDVWENEAAEASFRSTRTLKSTPEGGDSLRVVFRNCTPLPLVLCWISELGLPHHYYTLEPFMGLPSDPLSTRDHSEHTNIGHAFVLADCENVKVSKKTKTLDRILGGYRPTRRKQGNSEVHLVTVLPRSSPLQLCCHSPNPGERDRQYIRLRVVSSRFDATPIDTSKKIMEHCTLGGWPVRLEPDCFRGDEELKELFCRDIRHAVSCLPKHARDSLIRNTPFFINKTLKYGPVACPVNGRGMCFHPSPTDWLEEMGMSTEKCEAIEVYNAQEYWEDHELWGPGGVFVHEMSHAYHFKCVKDGYDNKEIRECYELAMKEGLYKCIKVHGPQGPTAKAYACENEMEYFAELSTAFLGGLDGIEEYNKWYPFNRKQLKEYDPRAYTMLQRIWKINCDDNQ